MRNFEWEISHKNFLFERTLNLAIEAIEFFVVWRSVAFDQPHLSHQNNVLNFRRLVLLSKRRFFSAKLIDKREEKNLWDLTWINISPQKVVVNWLLLSNWTICNEWQDRPEAELLKDPVIVIDTWTLTIKKNKQSQTLRGSPSSYVVSMDVSCRRDIYNNVMNIGNHLLTSFFSCIIFYECHADWI